MFTQKLHYRLSKLLLLIFVPAFFISIDDLAEAAKGEGQGLPTLETEEIAALNYMREEEKLARDVYLVMNDLWATDPFAKIAVSEQQHMDTMKRKLDKYGLPDPASPLEGVFNNQYLQEKYNELVALGVNSLKDGLYVGATIEEIDMIDIQDAISVTDNLDVVVSYESLLEGSKNHLRAYVNALMTKTGVDYEPQFISQELFAAIMDQ